MINEDPNMGRKQIFTELPLPSKVEEKGILTLIYKGVFIGVKLLLDIRLNLVKISEGKTIKTKYKQEAGRLSRSDKPVRSKSVDNAVIKDTDNITVKVEPKADDIKVDLTNGKVIDDSGKKPYEKEDEKSDDVKETKPETDKKSTEVEKVNEETKDQEKK